MSELIYLKRKSNPVASVEPDGTLLIKKFDPRNFLRFPERSISIHKSVLNDGEHFGADKVRVAITDGRVFEATYDQFIGQGFDVDRGWGRQRALALRLFEEVG